MPKKIEKDLRAMIEYVCPACAGYGEIVKKISFTTSICSECLGYGTVSIPNPNFGKEVKK